MGIAKKGTRAPMGRATPHDLKRTAGRTDSAHTPLSVCRSAAALREAT